MPTREPFRLKPNLPSKTKREGITIRVEAADYWLLRDLRERSGIPLGEIIHQCLEYCMSHTDLDDRTQNSGFQGVQIQTEYLRKCDENGNS